MLLIHLPKFKSQIGCLPYFDTWCGLSVNLECMSEMFCTWLAGNTGAKKSPKIRHLGTITQLLSGYILATNAVSTIGKNSSNSNTFSTYPDNGELRPTNGWDLLASLGYPSKFQRVSRLGSVTARHSSSGWQPNCGVEGAIYIRQGGHHVGHWPTF